MRYDEDMHMNRKWFSVSLRFQGDGLDVEQIGTSLEIVPTYIGRRCEHIRSNPRYAKHHTDQSEDENRMVTFGVSSVGRVLVVVHTDRGDAIRVISSRIATKQERRIYEEA